MGAAGLLYTAALVPRAGGTRLVAGKEGRSAGAAKAVAEDGM